MRKIQKFFVIRTFFLFSIIIFGGIFLININSVKATAETCYWSASTSLAMDVNTNWQLANGTACAEIGGDDSLIFDSTTSTNANWGSEITGMTSVTISSGYTGAITVTSSVTVSVSSFTQNGGTFNFGTSTFQIGSNWIMGGTSTQPATGLIGIATTTISGDSSNASLYNIETYPGTPVILGTNLSLAGTFTIGVGGTFNAGSYTLTLSGTGTPFVHSGGTFNNQTGTISYSGATANVASNTYSNLTLGTGTYTMLAATTVTGTLTMTADGTLNAGGYTLTLSGTGTPLVNSGATFNAQAGTVTYSGASASIASTTFANLNLQGDSTLTGAVTVTNTLALTAGKTLTAGANVITFTKDTGTPFSAAGATLTAGTGTVTYSGTSANIASTTYYNLTVNNTGTLLANTTVSGVLTINSGKTLNAGGFTLTLSGTGTPLVHAGATINNQSGTVSYSGATANVASTTYSNLTLGTGTYTMLANTTVTGTLSLTAAGTLVAGTNNLTFTKDTGTPFTAAGATLTAGTGTVTYSGTSANIASTTYYNLTVNNTGTLLADTTVSGVLTVNSGKTLNAGGYTLTLSGTGTPLVHAGATFNNQTGTVTYSGATANVASTTYSNLTLGTGTYTMLAATTVTGTLTNTGTFVATSTLTLSGSGTPLVNSGTFTANSSTVSYTNAGSVTTAGATFWTLTLGSGTYAFGGNTTSTNSFTNGGILTIGSSYYLYAPNTFDNNGTTTESGIIKHPITSSKLTDSSGTEVTTYGAGDSVYINVVDSDGNLDASTVDTITGSVVTASTYSDSETVTLTETGVNTSIFRSTALPFRLFTGAVNNNAQFEVAGNGTLNLAFTDSKDSTDTGLDSASFLNSNLPSGQTGGGGGGGSTVVDITPPTNTSISIASGVISTTNVNVTLTLGATGASYMMINNSNNFTGSSWEAYVTTKSWTLTSGVGTKTVYVKFKDTSDNISTAVSDTIELLVSSTDVVPVPESTIPTTPPSTSVECSLTVGGVYKYVGNPAVYYITEDCTKRPFNNSKVFFTYFDSWSDVKIITKATINSISDDVLNFMPQGQKYDPKYGALVKIVKDPKVYLLLGTEKYWITSETVFNDLKYSWEWIEDVAPSLLDQYTIGSEINYTNRHPNYTIVKYTNDSKVYKLEPDPTDSTMQVKRHIKDEATFNSLNFRWDRIVSISDSEIYADGSIL